MVFASMKTSGEWLAGLAFPLIVGIALAQPAPPDPVKLYAQRCAACHGDDASGSDRGPPLSRSRRLRSRSLREIHDIIQKGTSGGMPPFALSEDRLQALAGFVRSMNGAAFDAPPEGDTAAGERFFFGRGQCASCHTALGRGKPVGPDLTTVGRQLTLAELTRKLKNPGAQVPDSYATVSVRLRDGRTLRGFARKETLHSLLLQTLEGRLLVLRDGEYEITGRDKTSTMPPLNAAPEEERNLIAFLSRLGGLPAGALAGPGEVVAPAAIDAILHPKPGEWPTYNGSIRGNRHSALDQINRQNVKNLAAQWVYSVPFFGLETTPLVADGVMYITGPNQVYALDPRSGTEIWRYSRPRSSGATIAADAAKGANRGVALLGDRVFYTTDDAHLLCLDRLTGALRWDVYMPEAPQHYGATAAPLVVGDLVVAGVAGADDGIRGFLAAYKAATGQLAWRFWTVPREGEAGWDTWKGNAVEFGGGSTWLTGSYDPDLHLLYWPTGNPFPDTDGSERAGDNLYTNCILALDPVTGKLRWHFQFTPHDLHDWDAVQPAVLVDAQFQGRMRKLLLHADRNGFYYVLDRTNGELLLARAFARRISWASGIDAKGRPIELPGNVPTPEGTATCPDIRGAANWMSTAYNPATSLYYVMTIENCGTYRSTQFGLHPAPPPARGGRGGDLFNVPGAGPPRRYLRAIEMQTGNIAWETEQKVPTPNYGGVLSTAGGLVFYSESGGALAAVDAQTGRALWHFETSQAPKASPMTYMVDGRQYVAIASGSNVVAFALPE
ncbi:MAG: PQQ-binding-like beta-propeller repeat protein [Candidatus Sulfopaludibacter sp.]|nr:PQQ-binding-like beta-propeller repeat protein [Candidatus Sulfopaludibacter sp.]